MSSRSALLVIAGGSLAFGLFWYLALALLPYSAQLVLFPKHVPWSWGWPVMVPVVAAIVLAGRAPGLQPYRVLLGIASGFVAFVGGILGYVVLCNVSAVCM